jgi:Peptidase family M1 domain
MFPADAELTSALVPESPVIVIPMLLMQQVAGSAASSSAYWQQQVAYEIAARLDEPSGVLSGTERIQYTNRSPDTLTSFSLHLYLNAFRPGSRWAAADSAENRRRFNDLKDPDFAFNHVRNVRIMGTAVEASYPFAPDSTIARFVLPRSLPPGESMTVEMAWDARPSTLPRRQGRQGRRFDFAQWYPKVVVYDRYGWEEHPLYPAGEFYGEFGSFLVDLDLPEDQIVGATGVPVCGDPGWERANRNRSRPVEYQRNYYGGGTPPGATACGGAGPGRKKIRWYAEDVHHFAFSLNPEYRYEGGRFGDVVVHALYQPGDEPSWGGGVAVERTEIALRWLDQLFGRFAWPQITNLHRIEGGGTEFPMMMMNGSADQGLIVHELGHNYTMGILANNEWREGWLDEGFTSFQTDWFWEAAGQAGGYEDSEAAILRLDLDDYSEPPSLVAETYRDFSSYNTAIYTRGKLFFHQLRYIVGHATMQRILRTFYQRWKLRHVDEAAFRAVAEEVSGRDLSTFFAQWLHSTVLYDYAVGKVKVEKAEKAEKSERWITRVEVIRKEAGRIPVEVAVIARRDTGVARSEGSAEREWVEVETGSKPKLVRLDPRVRTHDWNMLNNQKPAGGFLAQLFGPRRQTETYFHPYFATRSRRDRITIGLHPTVWYNDAGGVTVGFRSLTDYLGRFEQDQTLISVADGWGADNGVEDVNFFYRYRNPLPLRAPNASQTLDVFNVEGRYGITVRGDWSRRAHLNFGPIRSRSLRLQWVAVDDVRYLDPGLYDDVGTVELQLGSGVSAETGDWRLSLRSSLGGGLAYNQEGLEASGRPDLDPFYFRGSVEGTARRQLGRFELGARLYAGAATGDQEAAKQRQIYFQGADPLEQLTNPFLRSRGALLVGEDFHYHAPGGGGVRGADARSSAPSLVALNLELERTLIARPSAGLFSRVALAAFTDLAHSIGETTTPLTTDRIGFLADAGFGLRAAHRIGDTEFSTRFDFPLYVSQPEVAQDRGPGDDELEFRWTFSFEKAF